MKRFVILVMALCLCFPAFTSAESLFPLLPTPEPASNGLKVPSYGGMANVDPDDIQPFAEGGMVATYENVDEQGYNDFGVYMGGLGFEVLESNIVGRTVELKLSDGKFIIGMIYDANAQSLKLIYEEGVEFEGRQGPIEDEPVADEEEPAGEVPADESTPSMNDDVCDHCNGLGTCGYCYGLGTCDHCFGDGTTMCETCFGSGSCPSCDGLGYLDNYSPLKDIQQIRCSRCSGTGRCTRCGGVGYPQCAYCNGTGACAYCKGTTVCQYCHGTGRK